MAKRKSTGKRQRFEIFKRDGFACAYCGRSPPDVLLHVDHIIAVANGGTNDATNLVTACADCNGGKSAIPLSSIAPSLKVQAEDAKERAEQVRAYSEMLLELQRQKQETADSMFAAFSDSLEWPPEMHGHRLGSKPEWMSTLVCFVERLTVAEILEGIHIAKRSASYKPNLMPSFRLLEGGHGSIDNLHNRWRYFCGVCWKKIRDREAGTRGGA